jgi:hypothetical protein
MKNKQNINPIGLKGREIHERQLALMGMSPINENENKKNSAVELTKIGPDGNAYAIVRENHEYFIKRTYKSTGLVLEDFKYIGGLQNKKDEAYPSYAKAIKQLNLKFKSLAEAFNRGGDINVFEDDNLLSENARAGGFSQMEGNGFSGENNFKENEEIINKFEKQYGDDGESAYYATANKQGRNPETFEKNEGMMGDDVEEGLNEFEQAIDDMMSRYDEEEMSDRDKELAAMKPPYDEITQGDVLDARGVDLDEEWKSDFDGNRDFDEYYDDKKEFISKYGSIYDIVNNLDVDMSAFDSEIEENIFGEFLNDELNTLTKFNLPQGQALNGEKIRFKSSPNGNTLSTNIYTLPENKYGYYSNSKDAYLMSNNKEQIIKLAAIEEKLHDYSRSSAIDKQTSRAESGWVDETNSFNSMEESIKRLDKMITSLSEGTVKKKVATKK